MFTDDGLVTSNCGPEDLWYGPYDGINPFTDLLPPTEDGLLVKPKRRKKPNRRKGHKKKRPQGRASAK